MRKGEAILQKQATQDGMIQPSITPVNIAKQPASTDLTLNKQYDDFITQLQLLDNDLDEFLTDLDNAYIDVQNPDRDFRAKAKHNPEFEPYTDRLRGAGIYDNLTVQELKRELTSRRIAYGARDNKEKLLERLNQTVTRNIPERKTSESPAREMSLKQRVDDDDYDFDQVSFNSFDDRLSYNDAYPTYDANADSKIARRLDDEELGKRSSSSEYGSSKTTVPM